MTIIKRATQLASLAALTAWVLTGCGGSNDALSAKASISKIYVAGYFHNAKGSATLNAINPVGGSTGLKVDSQLALSPGLGMSVKLDEKWFLNLSWAKTFLKTTTTLSTGQTIDTTLNPSVTTQGVGMRF